MGPHGPSHRPHHPRWDPAGEPAAGIVLRPAGTTAGALAAPPARRPSERPFHPCVDNTTGRIKDRLWKVIFFPKPEKLRLGAQTFSSLFRNNKSSAPGIRSKLRN